MTVYVDNMRAPYGRMVLCHCWADSVPELMAMMDRIGVQRKWFQRPDMPEALPGMDASWEHFDISLEKRALAVQAGAIETDKYGPMEHIAKRKIMDAITRGDPDAVGLHTKRLRIIADIRAGRYDGSTDDEGVE